MNYSKIVSKQYKSLPTIEKLELCELGHKIADKLNLDATDLQLHESILLIHNISKQVYKTLDEIQEDRKYWRERNTETIQEEN